MIINYKIYEGFLKKKIDYSLIFNEIYDKILSSMKNIFKEYIDYKIHEGYTHNYSNENKYKEIHFYNKYNYKINIIIVKIEINKKLVNINIISSDFFRNFLDNNLNFKYNKIDYNSIDNIFNQLEGFCTKRNIDFYLYYNYTKEKLSKELVDKILTKDYDYIVEFLMKLNVKNAIYINFKRCSKENKDKYEHYINANKFDLI